MNSKVIEMFYRIIRRPKLLSTKDIFTRLQAANQRNWGFGLQQGKEVFLFFSVQIGPWATNHPTQWAPGSILRGYSGLSMKRTAEINKTLNYLYISSSPCVLIGELYITCHTPIPLHAFPPSHSESLAEGLCLNLYIV